MPASLQSRTQYLALAEFCQNVIAGLMDFTDGTAAAPSSLLRPKLREALQSLDAISSGQLHALARAGASPFGTFEQVRTLQEVWDDAELRKGARLIRRLLAPGPARVPNVRSAEELIELFSRLQTRALWNFRQPRQPLPKSFRELCRAL